MHFLGAAKVIYSRLRGVDEVHSSPPVNNFGIPISREALARQSRNQTEKSSKTSRKERQDAKVKTKSEPLHLQKKFA